MIKVAGVKVRLKPDEKFKLNALDSTIAFNFIMLTK